MELQKPSLEIDTLADTDGASSLLAIPAATLAQPAKYESPMSESDGRSNTVPVT